MPPLASALVRTGLALKLNQVKRATSSYIRDRSEQTQGIAVSYAVAAGLYAAAGVFLIATLLVVAGFNIVYIFSSAVTGFQGTPLAILLLVYGLFGVVGNMMAGPLTDRFGSRTIATVFFALEGAALLALVFIGGAFLPIVIVFAVWGVSAFAATVPLQHRLVAVDHQTAAVAISWFSTALYIGIATAPLLGSAAIATGDVALVPLIGTVVTGLALIAFQLGFALRSRRTGRPAPATLGA